MRAGLLIAVLLLAACAGAPPSSSSPHSSAASSTTSPVATPGEPVRMLADGLFGLEPLAVAAATNEDDYNALWQQLERSDDAPPVDFERELVFYLGMAGSSSCPERFQRLVVDPDEGRVHAEWRQDSVGNACTDDLAPQGVMLAVSRAELPSDPFVLSLRDEPVCPDCPEQIDRATVDPAAR